jgi:hypothetical protein
MGRISNIECPPDFPAGLTGPVLSVPGLAAVDLIVTNAAIEFDVGHRGAGGDSAVLWRDQPTFLPPGGYAFTSHPNAPLGVFDSIRFRSAGTTPARITAFGQ